VTVNSPVAGTYPIEIDYTECCTCPAELSFDDSTGLPIPSNQDSSGGSGTLPPAQTFGKTNGSGINALAPTGSFADAVNSLTGAFTTAQTDLSTPRLGVPFTYTRIYTSADTTVGRLRQGWTDSFSASLAVQPNGDVSCTGRTASRCITPRRRTARLSAGRGRCRLCRR